MKGKLTALLLILVAGTMFHSSLQAQEGLKLGFVAIPQSTWMLNQQDMEAAIDQFDYQLTWGMAAGPMVGYNFSDKFGVRTNILYSAQGQRYQAENSEGTVINHVRRLNYLKTPLLVGFNTGTEFNKLVFSFHAGYQANFLINANYRNDDESYTPDEALADDITDYPTNYQRYSWFNHGPVVDFGLDIKLTYNVMANIHLRGDYTISDVENKNAAYKFWQFGTPEDVTFYPSDRGITNNLTGGLVIGLTYTFSSY